MDNDEEMQLCLQQYGFQRPLVVGLHHSICRTLLRWWFNVQHVCLNRFVHKSSSFTDLEGNNSKNDKELETVNKKDSSTTQKDNQSRQSRGLRVRKFEHPILIRFSHRRLSASSINVSASNRMEISISGVLATFKAGESDLENTSSLYSTQLCRVCLQDSQKTLYRYPAKNIVTFNRTQNRRFEYWWDQRERENEHSHQNSKYLRYPQNIWQNRSRFSSASYSVTLLTDIGSNNNNNKHYALRSGTLPLDQTSSEKLRKRTKRLAPAVQRLNKLRCWNKFRQGWIQEITAEQCKDTTQNWQQRRSERITRWRRPNSAPRIRRWLCFIYKETRELIISPKQHDTQLNDKDCIPSYKNKGRHQILSNKNKDEDRVLSKNKKTRNKQISSHKT